MTSDEADWLLEAQQRILKLEREIQRMRDAIRQNCVVRVGDQLMVQDWVRGVIRDFDVTCRADDGSERLPER
jgi:hypothetical protein